MDFGISSSNKWTRDLSLVNILWEGVAGRGNSAHQSIAHLYPSRGHAKASTWTGNLLSILLNIYKYLESELLHWGGRR